MFLIQCLALLPLLISYIHCSVLINKRDADKPEEQWVSEGEDTALWDPLVGKRKGGEKDGGEKSQGLCELALRPFWGNPAKDS